MWQFVFRRLLLMIPIFFVLSVIIFSLIHIVPGTPIDNLIGPGMTKAHEQKLIDKYHLDKPLPVQYGIWLANLFKGDLGTSIIEKRPVTELLRHHLPYSLSLGLLLSPCPLFWGFPWVFCQQRQKIPGLIMRQWWWHCSGSPSRLSGWD